MTSDERNAETAKAMAAACFRQMTIAQQAHGQVATIVGKWGQNPAFEQYIVGMGLARWLDRFVAGGPLIADCRPEAVVKEGEL